MGNFELYILRTTEAKTMIKRRLARLEAMQLPEPELVKSAYLQRLCAEHGLSPYITPRKPADVVRDMEKVQREWRQKRCSGTN